MRLSCYLAVFTYVCLLVAAAQVQAQDPPQNASLVGHWDEYNGAYADVWADGDYAYVGSFTLGDGNLASVHVVDISDTANPVTAATYDVPSPNQFRSPQDVKVANDMLFIGFESGGTDLVEIVDVRDPANPVHFATIQIVGFDRCHNTFFDNGYLYVVDSNTPRVAIVDLTTVDLDSPPGSPISEKWVINNVGTVFVHDITVRDNRLYTAAWDSGLWVYDVSNVATELPTLIGSVGGNNTHSMWPTDDGMFVVVGEERGGGGIDVYEVEEIGGSLNFLHRDSLVLQNDAFSVHNQIIIGNRLYVSWYQAGLQVFDIDPVSGTLEFYASYDTSGAGLGGFAGAWGVYPFLGDDKILVSDMAEGLFIINAFGPQISFEYPDGLVNLTAPAGGTELRVNIVPEQDAPDSDTGQLFARIDGAPFAVVSDLVLDQGVFVGTLPPAPCGGQVDYYVSITTLGGMTLTDPADAPNTYFSALAADELVEVLSFDFEADAGWTVSGDASDGAWERDVPITTCDRGNPTADFDGSGACFLTDNEQVVDCNTDVDGGATVLTSPTIDLSGLNEPFVEYARWFSNTAGSAPNEDVMEVWISNNDGQLWNALETVGPSGAEVAGGWHLKQFRVSDFLAPTSTMRFEFSASDNGSGSVVEAGLDAVRFFDVVCGDLDAPVVTVNPTDQVVCEGDTAQLSVSAVGAAPLSYQWRLNGEEVSGATEDTLAIVNADAADIGAYTCVVTNEFGSTESAAAQLTVLLPSSCDDQNECTIDTCEDAACVNTDSAELGQCCDPMTGDLTPIDDGDACTDDLCDSESGIVTHPPIAPSATGVGGRYLEISPSPSCTDEVALLITAPEFPCLSKYVAVNGRLVDTPVFQTPGAWSPVYVSDSDIVPDTEYRIQSEDAQGLRSAQGNATTWVWGDADQTGIPNLADVQLVVFAFQGNFELVTLQAADLEPCVTNGLANLADAFAAALAFQGENFSEACGLPCE